MNRQGTTPHAFEIEVQPSTGLEVLRTRLAIERTMAAWMRTVILFVAFGFTIVEFFQRVAFAENIRLLLRPQTPRQFGLAMIATGLVSLAVAIRQYGELTRQVDAALPAPLARVRKTWHLTPIMPTAILLFGIGVFAFIAMLFGYI